MLQFLKTRLGMQTEGGRRSAPRVLNRRVCLQVEALDQRLVPATLQPTIAVTPAEQYLTELINDARAVPADAVAQVNAVIYPELNRAGFDLNEGLAPGTISPTPKQPLA